MIGMNFTRPRKLIEEKISRRVRERDRMAVDGVIGQYQEAVRGWNAFRVLTKLFLQYFDFKPPPKETLDRVFPVKSIDWEKIQHPPKGRIQITWLGHSGLLVQMDDQCILTDPVFSDRCSPFQWIGPKRYRPPPCTLEELCNNIPSASGMTVLVSHNHYDHLDYNSVHWLLSDSNRRRNDIQFVVPLGLQEWFLAQNFPHKPAIFELDWHEHMQTSHGSTVTALPMRHWSNRTGDRDATLWCGYSILGPQQQTFLFPGDTAWFDDLEGLGETYGPWDLAALPIGAYAPREFMQSNHVNVPEAIRMKDVLRAKSAVPIHWGTFPLTIEPVMEPRDRLVELMSKRDDSKQFAPWRIGETLDFPCLRTADQ